MLATPADLLTQQPVMEVSMSNGIKPILDLFDKFQNRACPQCGSQMVRHRSGFRRTGEQHFSWRCRDCTRVKQNIQYGHEPKRIWDRANRYKRKAHKIVEYALMRGDLIREPCERCGTTDNVQAHHDDYSRPLDIMWLCPSHHGDRHSELRCGEAKIPS